MDVLLLIVGILCILIGLIGCVAPGLPGPPISYTGLLLLHWSKYAEFSNTVIIVLLALVIFITLADNLFPIYMTKKFGGSKWGTWGATIGLVVGMIFFQLWGTIFGPFVGALAGELLYGAKTHQALKSAFGSLVGFLFGVGGKLIVSGVITFYFFKGLFF